MGPIKEAVFKAGEPLPDLTANTLRLYSMRLCPFAQRTRLVLAHKNIEHETVNVHLKQKPDWFFQRNPLGLVPILEKDGKIVYESGICDDYLEEIFPERPLYPKDPHQKATMRMLMERFGKVVSTFHSLVAAGADEAKKQEKIKEFMTALQPFEEALSGKFFGGDDLSMLDIHTWPWFERMEIRRSQGQDPLQKFPKLSAWRDNMLNHETVKATFLPPDIHAKFVEGYMKQQPDFDIGL